MGGEGKWFWDKASPKAPSYEQIPEDLDNPAYSSTAPLTTSIRWKIYLSSFLVAAVILSTGAYIATTAVHAMKPESIDTLTCGTTNEDAISRGCIMEPMLYGWMPSPCYYPELSTQYTPFEDRDWYTNRSYLASEKISPEDVWAGKYKDIFTRQYHGEHCLFLWRKLAMAVKERREWLDDKTLNVDHVDHCSMVLEDHGIEWKNSSNDVVLGFYECRRINWG